MTRPYVVINALYVYAMMGGLLAAWGLVEAGR